MLETAEQWRVFLQRWSEEWLEVEDPQLLDVYNEIPREPYDGLSLAEYFAYDPNLMFDNSHFRATLKLSDPVPGDSLTYLLNPLAVAENGEWEAWQYAHWI